MSKVSVIIPSRSEKLLRQTVTDLLTKAAGDIEIIVVLDGISDYDLPLDDPRVRIVQVMQWTGMRNSINLGAAIAHGKFLMKLDSHCLVSDGWDEVLQKDCDGDWLVIGRRNELDGDNWSISDHTPCDYFYISCPWTSPEGYSRDYRWTSRQKERGDILVDETMTIPGSMWFMHKRHFFETIGMMDVETFNQWCGEPQELAGKTWLSGGKVMVNKSMVYAHKRFNVHENYHVSYRPAVRQLRRVTTYLWNDEFPKRVRTFGDWIDHFWPLPTLEKHERQEKYLWEANWRELYDYKEKRP